MTLCGWVSRTGFAGTPVRLAAYDNPSQMISASGSRWWIRLPICWYINRKSVPVLPSPHVGVRTVPPIVAFLGSFLTSYAATSGLCANAVAMVCHAAWKRLAGQLSLYHRPLLSAVEQHQPPNSM